MNDDATMILMYVVFVLGIAIIGNVIEALLPQENIFTRIMAYLIDVTEAIERQARRLTRH